MNQNPPDNAPAPRSVVQQQACSVANVANTPITEAFARTADWKSAMEFCRTLERRLNAQREALEAADECLALIEDGGSGAMSDNVTVARGIVLAALSQNTQLGN